MGLSELPSGLRHWDPVWCFPGEIFFQFCFISKVPFTERSSQELNALWASPPEKYFRCLLFVCLF